MSTEHFETLADGSWEISAGKSQINPTRFEDPLTEHLNKLNSRNSTGTDLPEDFHGALQLGAWTTRSPTSQYVLFSGLGVLDGWDALHLCGFDRELGDFAGIRTTLRPSCNPPTSGRSRVAQSWAHFWTTRVPWTVRKMDRCCR